MNRKFLALAFSLCIVTLPTNAATWIRIGESNRGDVFSVDKSSLQKDGDSVTFWEKIDYKERSVLGDLSSKLQTTINCRRKERIHRYMVTYDDNDNRGRVTASWQPKTVWVPIAPESIDSVTMQFVCN